MVEITTIGLDIAKNVFQVHGVGAAGQVAVRRQLYRAEVVRFFGRGRGALSAWRRAGARIIGLGKLPRWGTRFAFCRRRM